MISAPSTPILSLCQRPQRTLCSTQNDRISVGCLAQVQQVESIDRNVKVNTKKQGQPDLLLCTATLLGNTELQPPGAEFDCCICFLITFPLCKEQKPDKFTNFINTRTENILIGGQSKYVFFWLLCTGL